MYRAIIVLVLPPARRATAGEFEADDELLPDAPAFLLRL